MPSDVAAVIAAARELYDAGPLVMRRMQHLRPYICPFEALLPVVPRGARVLDVGCGSGLFLGLLHRLGYGIRGEGFDASRAATACAETMARRHGDGCLRFSLVDKDEPWPVGEFDVVSMIDVLHHIPVAHQESAFEAAAERVRRGGLLLYKDMSASPWHLASMNRLHDLVVAREWIHYVPVARVEQWASRMGLKLRAAEQFQRLWYLHDLRVFER